MGNVTKTAVRLKMSPLFKSACAFEISVLFLVLCLGACGRYLPPIAPELLAPRSVEDLIVTPSAEGLSFSWSAPQQDQRGKELRSANGYRIRRKELVERGDETNDGIPFREVGYVPDKHIEVRDQLRAEARRQGRITRKVDAPEELTKFTFTDTTAVPNRNYLYKVVPENQGSIEGANDVLIKVLFKGAESDITLLKSNQGERPQDTQGQQARESTPS